MPTVSETIQGLRAEATTNAAALASVRAQALARVAEIELWPASPSKAALRDQANRLVAEYGEARAIALRAIAIADQVFATIGSGTDPDPDPPAVVWSTGAW